jgi:hypothetical protein
MKKIILSVLAVAIIGFFAATFLQKDEFHVSRSISIDAKANKIFPLVNNLKTFNEWSPWAKLDANAKTTFEGPAEGVGSKMSWEGNSKVGKGSMTNLQTRKNEFLQYELNFIKPMAATHMAEFTFKEEGKNTVVTWSTYGKKTFICKMMSVVFSTDKMIGEQFEKGLIDLKVMAEKK